MQTGAQHLSPCCDEYTDEPKNMVSSVTLVVCWSEWWLFVDQSGGSLLVWVEPF